MDIANLILRPKTFHFVAKNKKCSPLSGAALSAEVKIYAGGLLQRQPR
jgi:hypothetical protein